MKNKQFEYVILPAIYHKQSTKYTCGPASLFIALKSILNKINISEKQLAKICRTTPEEGTSPKKMVGALKKLKIKYQVFEHGTIPLLENKLLNLNLCLVNYQAWNCSAKNLADLDAGHYAVMFGFNKKNFYISDPLEGFITKRKDLFEKRWQDKENDNTKTHHWMIAVPIKQ